MPKYRKAVRRTQREIDRGLITSRSVDIEPQDTFADTDYRGLQDAARARGIPVKQTADALRAALAIHKDRS